MIAESKRRGADDKRIHASPMAHRPQYRQRTAETHGRHSFAWIQAVYPLHAERDRWAPACRRAAQREAIVAVRTALEMQDSRNAMYLSRVGMSRAFHPFTFVNIFPKGQPKNGTEGAVACEEAGFFAGGQTAQSLNEALKVFGVPVMPSPKGWDPRACWCRLTPLRSEGVCLFEIR